MTDYELEQCLRKFDFSDCCAGKEKIKNQLINMQKMRNGHTIRTIWALNRLNEDELDMAVAAGNEAMQERMNNQRKKFEPTSI